MSVLLTAAALAAGGALISNAPKLFKSKFEKEEEARLKELQRRQQQGALGISDQERSAIEARFNTAGKASHDANRAIQQQLIAGQGGASGGTELLQGQIAQEQAQQVALQRQAAITNVDLQQKAEDEATIQALRAQQGEVQDRRRQAIADIAASPLEAAAGVHFQNQVIGQASPESISGLSKIYGISDAEAEGLLQLSRTNPEALKLMSVIGAQ